jgi:hypothetical protein
MNREEKIRLLNAVRSGLLMPEDLIPKNGSVFFCKTDGSYENNGEILSEQEYEAYIETLRLRGDRRRLAGLPEEYIINVVYKEQEGNEPIKE